jgi:hypothetical protein
MATVILFSNDLAEEREFNLKHAERILKYQEKKNISPENGWSLPEKSEYDFVNGKLITGTDQGKNTKAAKKE